MARRLLRGAALAVLTLSAAALVAACSSGATPGPASSSPSVPSSGEATQAASAGANGQPTPTVSAPPSRVILGPFTEVFATALPADPAQAKVIADWREGMILWDKSSEDQALASPVSSYVTGSAASTLKSLLSSEAKNHFISAGVDTLFDTRATISDSTHATVTTCDDGSMYTTMDTQTKALASVAPLNQQYIEATWGMTLVGGHWTMSSIKVAGLPAAAAKPCQPTA
jgi:hypothetical protein